MIGLSACDTFSCNARKVSQTEKLGVLSPALVASDKWAACTAFDRGRKACDNFVTIFQRIQRKSAVVLAMAGGYNL